MNTIIKKQDKTYGGYQYVEFNTATKVYQTGNSRSHRGHFLGNSISVEVTTFKELKQIEVELNRQGFRNETMKL